MTAADRVLILLALLMLAFVYQYFWVPSSRGEFVRIMTPEGERSLSLAEDKRISIAGPLGSSIIEIAGGRVRFLDSPCRNKQCIHSGWLHNGGEFAACLPNRISLLVSGRETRFDTLNF